jgi:hypothetical protein
VQLFCVPLLAFQWATCLCITSGTEAYLLFLETGSWKVDPASIWCWSLKKFKSTLQCKENDSFLIIRQELHVPTMVFSTIPLMYEYNRSGEVVSLIPMRPSHQWEEDQA